MPTRREEAGKPQPHRSGRGRRPGLREHQSRLPPSYVNEGDAARWVVCQLDLVGE